MRGVFPENLRVFKLHKIKKIGYYTLRSGRWISILYIYGLVKDKLNF